jgi:hypothetical protein
MGCIRDLPFQRHWLRRQDGTIAGRSVAVNHRSHVCQLARDAEKHQSPFRCIFAFSSVHTIPGPGAHGRPCSVRACVCVCVYGEGQSTSNIIRPSTRVHETARLLPHAALEQTADRQTFGSVQEDGVVAAMLPERRCCRTHVGVKIEKSVTFAGRLPNCRHIVSYRRSRVILSRQSRRQTATSGRLSVKIRAPCSHRSCAQRSVLELRGSS